VSDPAKEHFAVRQEADVVATRAILTVAIVAVIAASAAVGGAAALLCHVDGSLRPSAAGPGGPARPGRTISGVEQTPILDTAVGIDLRDRQRAELARWGWAKRDAGVATLPIDVAIDLVVEQEAR
jgi:hypothetical protein